MEFPLTANEKNYYQNDQSQTNKDTDNKKHRLGELIFSLEKTIKEQQSILETMKQLYYYG